MRRTSPRPSVEELERGVVAGERAVLARAITLVESRHEKDAALSDELVRRLLPRTGRSTRLGVTGVPGAGKSTFVDTLGMRLVASGKTVAVLAVDPSSSISGGSILGDKTRMGALALEKAAFIRPSPSGLSPGGIARRTREAILLCEAAGFDIVLVETVGVGQGEIAVSGMVDFLLVLVLAGAGDELQGIKKGVLEIADAIVVNKCDGDGGTRARSALAELRAALRYVPRKRPDWEVRAVAASGLTGEGLDELWGLVTEHHVRLAASGALAALRAEQQREWMWWLIGERLERAFRSCPEVALVLERVQTEVVAGRRTAPSAVDELVERFELASGLMAFLPARGVRPG